MSKWTRTIALALVALMVALAAGCGGTANKKEEPAAAPAAEPAKAPDPVTLNMWIMPNTNQTEQDMMTAAKPWLDKNPHVTLKVTVLDWGSALTKITTAATSGEGPDLLQLGTTWTPAVAATGALEKLNLADFGGKDAFFPASLQTCNLAPTADYYGIPWFVDMRAYYYRTDVFAKAGVDPKKAFETWDSFKAALQKINNTEINGKKVAAIGFPGKNDWNVLHFIFPWIWGAGGAELTPDNKKAAVNTDAAAEGLLFYTGLVRDGVAPKAYLEKNTADVDNAFHAGEFAILAEGPQLIRSYYTPVAQGGNDDKIPAKNYDVAPYPAGPKGRFTFFGGSNLSVWKSSKNKATTIDFLKYLASKEGQVAYAKVNGYLPAIKSAEADMLALDKRFGAFYEAAKSGRSYPSIAAWMTSEPIWQKHFGNIWDVTAGVTGTYGKDAIKANLEALAKDIDAHLKTAQ
ncbi:MAG TPA: sugar ABC transporter substrate-binding protein [Symbiobacteriaceae bacterium]|nr:sugar ABC transporter substrate-binding protein [Symbiobacteriaceae bacterium]